MSLPFDSSHPAIRLALKHARLQAFTPMAVLLNVAAVVICAVVLNPSSKEVSDNFSTPFNPNPTALALYWLVTFVLLISYCLLLIVANKPEKQEMMVYGVGLCLVFVQCFMALNIVAFTLKFFIASLVFTSLSLLFLVWIHLSLYMYPPHHSRPVEFILIHTPIRLLIVVTFLQELPQLLFIVLGWTYHASKPDDHQKHAWQAVAFIVAFNMAGVLEVALRGDFVWAFAGTWIIIGQLIARPKPAPVFAADLIFTIVYPVLYVTLFVWRHLSGGGRIALPIDEEEAEISRARAAVAVRNGQSRQ
ncbi:hypothetical protein BS47DRAFT_1325078 [Hydnum rufescens UP504]|uniref:Uncharacterized protein n=1 Tax=Hydnum rufescens UP504 TaxID=1448309 RepID=A0A9P6B9L0_9AGAM|nr:hypothetical protein BS47DRAFT_1325078 [Hydnum rufescens UP504]